jgi:hypothetical protein
VRELVERLSLDDLVRIDVGLEGDWSPSATTVWTRDDGVVGFDAAPQGHDRHIPSLELIFPEHWVGLRCYVREGNRNAFDEGLARTVVEVVERRLPA